MRQSWDLHSALPGEGAHVTHRPSVDPVAIERPGHYRVCLNRA